MSTVFKAISPAEYLVRDRKAEFKSEYFRGEMFAMAGGTPNHSLLTANFIREAGNFLKGRPCVVYSSDLRVKVAATGLYTYPDASIVCGPLEYDDDARDTIMNPAVVVEVLSESTEKYDRGRKASHYRQIESLKELILISQEDCNVERFVRQETGGWLLLQETNRDKMLPIESIGISISMAEVYRNVLLPEANKTEST